MIRESGNDDFAGNCTPLSQFAELAVPIYSPSDKIRYLVDNSCGIVVALKRLELVILADIPERRGQHGLGTVSISALREVSILRQLSHPNIVEMLGVAVGD